MGAISLLGGSFRPGGVDGCHPEDVTGQAYSLEALVDEDALHLAHHGGGIELINEEGEGLLWRGSGQPDERPELGPHVC